MAYIRKINRKKGTVYRAEVAFRDGSKRSETFRTKEEAQRWARGQEDIRESEKTSGVTRVRLTLDDYFEKWMNDYAKYHHAAGWQKADRQMYDAYVRPLVGCRLISEVHPIDIQRIMNEMVRRGCKHSYANRVRQMLSKMFNEALQTYRYIGSNPVVGVKKFREPPPETPHLSIEDAVKLLNWADREQLGLALHIGVNLGLRVGEIIGLKWDCVDFQNRSINIRRKWDKKMNVLDEFTKGNKTRTLGMYPSGLEERLKLQRQQYPEAEFVVCNAGGSMATPMQVWHIIKRARKDLGLGEVTLHGLRHTYASLYMQGGGDLYDLQKIMGHSSVSTTERYRHTDPEYLRKKCEVVDVYSAQIPPKVELVDLKLVVN